MYRKLLLTLDGSALSRSAVAHARSLTEGTDAEVVILQVVRPIESLRMEAWGQYEITNGDPGETEALTERLQFDQLQRARADVEGAKQELEAAGIRSVRTEVESGLAGNLIADIAEREGVDAIVMATRGHGGLGREVVGSVAEYVLRHAGKAAVVFVGPRSAAG